MGGRKGYKMGPTTVYEACMRDECASAVCGAVCVQKGLGYGQGCQVGIMAVFGVCMNLCVLMSLEISSVCSHQGPAISAGLRWGRDGCLCFMWVLGVGIVEGRFLCGRLCDWPCHCPIDVCMPLGQILSFATAKGTVAARSTCLGRGNSFLGIRLGLKNQAGGALAWAQEAGAISHILNITEHALAIMVPQVFFQ